MHQRTKSTARTRFWLGFALATVAAVTSHAAPKNDRPAEVDSPLKVKPGTTGLLKAGGKGMRYFLRVPRNYNERTGARLIVFLHGSNMLDDWNQSIRRRLPRSCRG